MDTDATTAGGEGEATDAIVVEGEMTGGEETGITGAGKGKWRSQ